MRIGDWGKRMKLLNPIGEVVTPKLALAGRVEDLKGKVIGVLDNKMLESTPLLEKIVARLSERFKLAGRETRTPERNTAASAADELCGRCDFVIAGFGCSGVYTIWCVQAAVEVEKRGTPAVMVCTEGLDAMCQAEARNMGLSSFPLLSLPTPEGGKFTDEDIEKAVDRLIDDIVFALTQPPEKVAERFAAKDLVAEAEKGVTRPKNEFSLEAVYVRSTEEVNSVFYENGWTDGLPVVAPTREALDAMLRHVRWGPEELIACLPPRMGRATVEKIAVNAVMAGCLPECLPVIISAVQAMAEPQFNLSALQATTNPVAPLTIVNGPLAKQLVINSGFNVFGQGWRSNASIGRAIRLILMNIGGGIPGVTDKALQGLPAKYTFCIGENEDESPWEPLHIERGFPREVSTVTVAGVQAHHNFLVLDRSPESILDFSASAMATLGANQVYMGGPGWPILALNPLFAGILAQNGYSKDDVRKYLFDHATIPLSRFPKTAHSYIDERQLASDERGEAIVRATGPMEDIMIIVTGAAGGHSQYLATMGHFIEPVTKVIGC